MEPFDPFMLKIYAGIAAFVTLGTLWNLWNRPFRIGDRVRHIQTGRSGVITDYMLDSRWIVSYDGDASRDIVPSVLLEKIVDDTR